MSEQLSVFRSFGHMKVNLRFPKNLEKLLKGDYLRCWVKPSATAIRVLGINMQ